MLQREQDKLDAALGGIKNMGRLPGAIFVVDINKEHLAVKEAIKLHIPIIAMVDTNSDPDIPDYIVPCNEDSARTIQLVTTQVADAIIEGNAEREAQKEEDVMEQAAAESKGESDDDVDVKDAARGTKLRSRRKSKKDNSGDSKKAEKAESSDDSDSNDEEE